MSDNSRDSATKIIDAVPSQVIPVKSRRKLVTKRKKNKNEKGYNEAPDESINDPGDIVNGEKVQQQRQRNSEGRIRGVDEQTMGESIEGSQAAPYEFLMVRHPAIFSIFFPRFTVKSITFFLTAIYIIMFVVLMIYNYSRTQNSLTWNCSLFHLQNKYFPKLRYNYEIWRVFVSVFFHSNIAHFILNLFGIQIYGYFTQWYYGKIKYAIVLIFSLVFSHFMCAAIQTTSISTTSSCILFAIIGLKLFFFYEYRNYKRLDNRRIFLYILLVLMTTINLIPIFVENNVDFGAHLGGIITGLVFGFVYYVDRIDDITTWQKVLRIIGIVVLCLALIALVAVVFSNSSSDYQLLSQNIDETCSF